MRSLQAALLLVCLAAILPSAVQAQEALPSVLPNVVFLVEDSDRMAANWDGDGNLTAPDNRWSYVRDAIKQVIQNAPIGMSFGVALTTDGQNESYSSGMESVYGFEPLAHPGMSTAAIVSALDAHAPAAASSSSSPQAVAWANAANVTVTANSVSKTSGVPGSWDAGATGVQVLTGDGYVEFTVNNASNRFAGLSDGGAGTACTDPEFAFSFSGGGTFSIRNRCGTPYKNGGSAGNLYGYLSTTTWPYSSGDVFRIERTIDSPNSLVSLAFKQSTNGGVTFTTVFTQVLEPSDSILYAEALAPLQPQAVFAQYGDISAAMLYNAGPQSQRTFAESYSALLRNWASKAHALPRSWNGGPFEYSCSELVVIMVGSNDGTADDAPEPGYFTPDPLAMGVQCNDNYNPPGQACFADNVAHYAYSNFPAPLAGTGAVKTYSLLIDANSTSVSTEAAPLFQSVANMGQGLFHSTATPGGVAVSFWNILNDTFSGTFSNAAISMTPDGSKLFGSYFEVIGGHPLYKGHLLGWNVNNDPASNNYGLIVSGPGSYGEAWDAGQLLASRLATSSENNQGWFDPSQQRNGYTASAAEVFYSAPMPFDASQLSAGSDLTTLLIEEVSAYSNQTCQPLAHDFDYDCDADTDDAQILIDFIRGVSTSAFLHTGIVRGPWKMGDTGHSVAVSAPHTLDVIATDTHFLAYRERLSLYPGMVYVASNAGMLHSFGLSNIPTTHEGTEYWFYVPRAKANRNPSSVYEYDGFQIDDLMRSGQTHVNEGKLVLEHVWLDGYSNGLGASANFSSSCSAAGYYAGTADGVIDPDGCEWHRVLVWSGGFGARHHYALDVTNPYSPRFLWERTDDGSSPTTPYGLGRAIGSPGLASFVDRSGSSPKRRWIVLWGAGSTSPGVTTASSATERSHASVYMHDVNSTTTQPPTTYPIAGFKATGAASHPHASVTNSDSDVFDEYGPVTSTSGSPTLALGLFGSPAMVDLDGDKSVDVGYIGDSLGYIFKVRFNEAAPTAATTCLFASPDPTDQSKKLFYRPAVFFSPAGELLVYYGSGSPFDIYDTERGGLYVKADGDPYGCTASAAAPCAATSTLFNTNGFWLFDGVGEKLVGDPIAAFGRLYFTTHTPGTDPCILGSSRVYGLDVTTCGGGIPDVSTDSYNQDSTQLYTQVDGLISQPVFANGQIYALNIDSSGLDSGSVIDDLQVTPNNMANYFYTNFRHVY